MNKQIISERIGHLARLVAELSVPSWTIEEYDSTSTRDGKPTGFFYISGHIRSVTVQVHAKGWDNDSELTLNEAVSFDELADPKNTKYGKLVNELNDYIQQRHEMEGGQNEKE